MTLSDVAIKNPVFSWMLMASLIVFGWLGYTRMGKSMLPDVDFPVISISVDWEGASPEVIESELTDVLEDAVMQVQGVKEVTSSSRFGNTTISIEFDLNRDIDAALQEVQTKIAQAQRNLPNDIDPPVVTKSNPEDNPIMWVSLSGNRPVKFLMDYGKDELKDQFTTIPGVGEVLLGGYIEPNLRVWLDADKMRRRDLTVEDVLNAIRSNHVEIPAGYIDTGKRELNVRVMGEAETVSEFLNIVIPQRAGSPLWKTVRIGDVATVEDGLADLRRISRVNGHPALGFGIKKQRGANAVQVAKAVKKRIKELEPTLPEGVRLAVNFDGTKFIEDSIGELNFTLILSAILTALVCWFFLGSFSSAVNINLAIPTAIIGTFLFIFFFGFTLNTFTLLGLTLVIGIVVDDAIMVLENIVRHRELGESRVHAALTGAREITFAALAASLAILAIFMPVVFMPGIVGRFFFQFGVTITIAVLLSLLEALTLAPMRCSQFLSVGHNSWLGKTVDRNMKSLAAFYRRVLAVTLRHRWTVVVLALVFFGASLSLMKFVRKEFVPPQDQSNMLIRIQTPPGSSIEFTNGIFKKAEAMASAHPEVLRYYAAIGGFGGGRVNTGVMFLTLKPPKERPVPPGRRRPYTQQEFMPVIRKELNSIPGVERAVVQDLSLAGFSSRRGFPVELTLLGRNWDELGKVSGTMMGRMKESGLLTDVDTDYVLGAPEIRVIPDRIKAAARGVSMASIGNTINAMIGGVRIGKYSRGGRRYDVRVRLVEADRSRPHDINKIRVANNRGETLSLADVVNIKEINTLLSISRKNRERAITIFANMEPGVSQTVALNRVKKIANDVLPEGVRMEFSGSTETYGKSFALLLFVILLGILVAYMVLGAQFNSFIHPISVLVALPFSVTGAFLALWIGGQSLNLYSMIGLILLMGIVKKNSILLVDFTNERRKAGASAHDALMEACPIRLRPVLMTSFATIAAAVPPALALGPGAETRIPMALVIIGGMAVSTFLTLLVVPSVYSLLTPLESHRHDKDLHDALVDLGEIKD